MRQFIIKLILPCVMICAPLLVFAADYRFERIHVPRSHETGAFGINARGHIVGYYFGFDDKLHGFLLRNGKFKSIDFPGAVQTFAARGINARGDIVGTFQDSALIAHGFLYSKGRFTQIDFPGASATNAEGINNAGDIMGNWSDASGNGGAYIRKNGKFHNVSFPGFSPLIRSAQDNGRVWVGHVVSDADGETRGFIRRKAGEIELIEYPGLSIQCTGVRHINQRGDMVGGFARINSGEECHPPFNEGHGFLLRDGQFTVIDFPGVPETQAFSINDDGVIVGRIRTKDDLLRGFKAVPKP